MKIVFLDAYTIDHSDTSSLEALGDYTAYETTHETEIVERCQGADIVIVNKVLLNADTLAQLKKGGTQLVCIAATGMNNVDLDAAAALGITVRNTAGYSTDSVAELTLTGALGLLKQTIYFDQFVKSGAYSNSDRLFDFTRPSHDLRGKRWGIVGFGAIGRRVAELATAFGCEVAYYSTSGANSNPDYPRLTLDELLAQSDVVSIHSPLNDLTLNLIDFSQLSLMKPSAIIINVARGGIVNESALARALNEGLIAGAAIDVYSREPMAADNPLTGVRDKFRLLLTPHSAWTTQEAMQRLTEIVAENIRTFTRQS
jgi:glycerate dehydrogenase